MTVALLLGTVSALLLLGHLTPARAQPEEGATMTVLRGEVAVLRPDGTAVQPAPSGTVIYGGDEIRTLTRAGALITFQVGTEIELGDDTILVVERVTRQGERIDVLVKQAQGATLHRVASFSNPGSSYRVEAGGAVTEVHGTEFLLFGPLPNGVLIIVCAQDCDRHTTFAGQPLSPGIGYYAVVENGKLVVGPEAFKPDLGAGLWNAAFEAATLAEQALQGDTAGVPSGQVPAGQQGQSRGQTADIKDQRMKGPAGPPDQDGQTGQPSGLAIDDVSVTEIDGPGVNAVFTVTRSGSTSQAASVQFQTADGTALAGSDYQATSGILIFPPGSAAETISVPIAGDFAGEATESFFVNLFNPINAVIGGGQGVGTIFDDEP